MHFVSFSKQRFPVDVQEVQADEIKSASSNHDMADSVEGDGTPFASLIQTENGRHPLTVFEEGNCKHDQPSATVSHDLSQVRLLQIDPKRSFGYLSC